MGDKWETTRHGSWGWLTGEAGAVMGFWAERIPQTGTPMERFAELVEFIEGSERSSDLRIYDEAKSRIRTGAVGVFPLSPDLGGGFWVVTPHGLDFAPVGELRNRASSRKGRPTGVPASVKVPEPFLKADNLRDVLGAHTADELRALFWSLPVEAITLDRHIEGSTADHDRLFQIARASCAVLANYEQVRAQHPDAKLSPQLPASELLDIVLPRLLARIEAHAPPDILPAAGPPLLSLARDLISGGRNAEAMRCLDICRGVLAINSGEVDMWTFASCFNRGYKAKDHALLRRALAAAANLPPARRAEIAQAVQLAQKELGGPHATPASAVPAAAQPTAFTRERKTARTAWVSHDAKLGLMIGAGIIGLSALFLLFVLSRS